MTTHLDIETISNDNGRSLYRTQKIKINGKVITTPLRALDPSKFDSNVVLNKKAFGLNEIYKNLNSDKLKTLQNDVGELESLERELSNLEKRTPQSDLNVCFLKFSSKKPNSFPLKEDVGTLTDIAHTYSDITPIPIIDAKIDDSNFSRYLNYVKNCYNTIEELNTKPIMGMLPRLTFAQYRKILDFYLDKQITAFCFDYDGRIPSRLMLRQISRYLESKNIRDNVLIYGINARPGSGLKNSNVIPSKDFLVYGYGVDVLGESHARIKLPVAFYEELRRATTQQQINKKRIFIKSDYGYYKINTKDDISSLYPKNTRIKLDDILDDPRRKLQKLFNMEQQSIESGELRKRLGSLDRNETILSYIEKKANIKNETKYLKAERKQILQKVLA